MATVFIHNRTYGPGIIPADGARYNTTNWEFPPSQEIPCEVWTPQTFIDAGTVFPTRFPTAFPALWESLPSEANPGPGLISPGFIQFIGSGTGTAGHIRRVRDTGDCGGGVAPVTAISGCFRVQMRLALNNNGQIAPNNLQQSPTLTAWEIGSSAALTRWYGFSVGSVKLTGATTTLFGVDALGTDAFRLLRKQSGGAVAVVDSASNPQANAFPVGTVIALEVRVNATITQAVIRGLINNVEVVTFTDNNVGGTTFPIPGPIGMFRNTPSGVSTESELHFRDLEVFPLDLLP